MPEITNELIRKIARLARLPLADEDLNKARQDFERIHGFFNHLTELPESMFENVEPMISPSQFFKKIPMRPDVVTDGEISEQVLANAPHREEDFFVVLKVID